tara:strand:+ start:1449 stop:1730 length:282 start_codon:yes stop_codon:yes gene_type:complete
MRLTPSEERAREDGTTDGTFPYQSQDIDGKEMAKMIIYLMDRHYPTRNLDALISALDTAAFSYEHGSEHEYYFDWKWLLELFQSIQAHNKEEQ